MVFPRRLTAARSVRRPQNPSASVLRAQNAAPRRGRRRRGI